MKHLSELLAEWAKAREIVIGFDIKEKGYRESLNRLSSAEDALFRYVKQNDKTTA